MDDARFNYVAQPEDGLDPADLLPKLGPYDKFAISWGYKPVPSARRRRTPEQHDARSVGTAAGRHAVSAVLDRGRGGERSG